MLKSFGIFTPKQPLKSHFLQQVYKLFEKHGFCKKICCNNNIKCIKYKRFKTINFIGGILNVS